MASFVGSKEYFKGSNTGGIGVLTNGPKVISAITDRLRNLPALSGQFVEMVANIFVERAQEKLLSSGYKDVAKFANNIYVRKYANNRYSVRIRDNQDKPIMFFLEFGTGFVGDGSMPAPNNAGKYAPHPLSDEFGWEYAIGPNIVYSTRENGKDGWYYFDENTGKVRFTSGLRAVGYLYDTIQEIPDIIEEVKRRIKLI